MEYHGKLYGKIGNKYFDTDKTSHDYDALEKQVEKLKELNEFICLIEFMEKINYMRKLYKNKKYTQSEKERDRLMIELDDVMRI